MWFVCISALTTNTESAETTSPYKNLLLENFLNPNFSHSTDDLKKSFSNLTKQFFVNADLATAYPNLFKLLWFSNIPCFKNSITDAFLLKKCFWNGEEKDCSVLFKQAGLFSWYWLKKSRFLMIRAKYWACIII